MLQVSVNSFFYIFVRFEKICKISVRRTLLRVSWAIQQESLREKSHKSIQILQIFWYYLYASNAARWVLSPSLDVFVRFVKICKISVRRTLLGFIWAIQQESLREKSHKSVQILQIFWYYLYGSNAARWVLSPSFTYLLDLKRFVRFLSVGHSCEFPELFNRSRFARNHTNLSKSYKSFDIIYMLPMLPGEC